MLDPWVIEEIKRREDERRREEERPRVQIPLHTPTFPDGDEAQPPKEEQERGVVVIDL